MKHLVFTAALVAATAGVAGWFSFRANSRGAVADALAGRDAMAWLRTDFQLTEPQFAAVKRLHDAYSVVCAEHCRAIQTAMRAREDLRARAEGDAAAFAAVEERLEKLRRTCESAITTHVQQCAAEMSPAAGQRYLSLVLPKIRDFDHTAVPDLRLNPHSH